MSALFLSPHRIWGCPIIEGYVNSPLCPANRETGWVGFLDIEGFGVVFPGFVDEFLRSESEGNYPSLRLIYEWAAQDLSSKELVESALDIVDEHTTRLATSLADSRIPTDGQQEKLREEKAYWVGRLEERRLEMEEQEERRAEYYDDDWKDQ